MNTDVLLENLLSASSRARGRLWGHLLAGSCYQLRLGPGCRIINPTKIRIESNIELRRGVLLNGRSDLPHGIIIASGSTLRDFCYLDAYGRDGHISVGSNCQFGTHVYVGGNGGVSIGRDVMISGGAFLVSATHNHDPRSAAPYFEQGEVRSRILVEDGVWIGAGATVLPGVQIGTKSVVGAGAVVTRSLPARVFAAGVPATVVRGL